MNFRRLRAIARKEMLHVIRDPRSLASAIAIPLIMLLIFGYALSLDVDRIPTIVYNLDQTPGERELVRDFQGSRYFEIDRAGARLSAYGEGDGLAPRAAGRRDPGGFFAQHSLRRREAQVQLLLDGSDSNTASIAQGYAEGMVQNYAARLRTRRAKHARRRVPPMGVSAEARVWYNPDMVSRNFIVPGLIAVIMMIITGNLSSLTIAREWENGTMEQLLSTPVRPSELALGKLAAYFLVGLIDMVICLFVGVYLFDVPFKGSLLFLTISSFVFLFGSLVHGNLGLGDVPLATDGLPNGHADFLPAGLPAFRIYLFDQQHAARDPGHRTVRSGALFHQYFEGGVPERHRPEILWLDFLLLCVYGAVMFFFTVRKLRQKVA